MGPVGVLCVRRTLHRGLRAGLLTGIGAALSDVFYASLVYLGVGLIIQFIETNQQVITLVGSLFILLFGAYLYFTPPNYRSQESTTSMSYSSWQLVLSSFLITASNPLIIFFFIAFFGRSGFVYPDEGYWFVFLFSMLFIFLGALLWWVGLTQLVNRLRKRISIGGVRSFNRIVAIAFILLALGGLVKALFFG